MKSRRPMAGGDFGAILRQHGSRANLIKAMRFLGPRNAADWENLELLRTIRAELTPAELGPSSWLDRQITDLESRHDQR